MRYTLNNGIPVVVTAIVHDGMRIIYPTDAQIDEAEAGYVLEETEAPKWDPNTQRLEESWILTDGKIVQTWTIIDLTQPTPTEKRIAEINQLLAESNTAFLTFKETPVVYEVNGLKYKPSYITDYWVPILPLQQAFPMVVSDADCVPQEMTYEEFTNLYTWLLGISSQEISRVNAYQKPLIKELAELQNGQN